MSDLDTLSALFKARGVIFKIEQHDKFGTLLSTAPKAFPDYSPDKGDDVIDAEILAHEKLAGYDHFYAVFQFDADGKLLHVGAYE
jgi:hypothetical protein